MSQHVNRRRMGIIVLVSLCGTVLWCKILLGPSAMLLATSLSGTRGEVHRSTKRTSIPTGIALAKTSLGDDINCHHVVSSSPPPRSRINMTLRRGHLMQNLYTQAFTCDASISNQTRHMHPTMNNTPGVLDFTTFLSTSLKILVMGDSVAMQISQSLEEMLGAANNNPAENHRKVYRYTTGVREGLHISAPIRGGGVVAGWRLLGMLLKENLNAKMPIAGPGWKMEDVYQMTYHAYNNMSSKLEGEYNYTDGRSQQQQRLVEKTTAQAIVGSFDVLLFHIPIGWIRDYNSINNRTLMETVLLAGELFGVETVVFNVPSFTNNILTAQHLQSLRAAQNRVLQFANDFVPNTINSSTITTNATTTVRRVLMLRMDRLMDQMMEWNARLMGLIPNPTTTTTSSTTTIGTEAAAATSTATSDEDENDWRLVTLKRYNPNRKYLHHVAQTCSALPSPETPLVCPPNYFSRDGMHVCMEKLGGRIFAGLGCVLGCAYNSNNGENKEQCQQQTTSSKSTALLNHEKEVLNCAIACNDRYLSLTSVDNEVLDS